MEQRILQWHPAFQAALQIELEDDQDALCYEREYNLSEKPLQIDLLIIKVRPGHQIRRSIGQIFRQYNIVEYKSPDDYISINDFYKVTGYAALFQANTEKVRQIPPEEITVTLASYHYPGKLIKFLKENFRIVVSSKDPGILYISGLLFPTQILLLSKLEKTEYRWLNGLRTDLALDDITHLSQIYQKRRKSPLYSAVMDLIIRANPEKYEEAKKMCEALHELYAEEFREIDKAYSKAKQELAEANKALKKQDEKMRMLEEQIQDLEQKKCESNLQKQICFLIETCQKLGMSQNDIITKLMNKCSLSQQEAEQALQQS